MAELLESIRASLAGASARSTAPSPVRVVGVGALASCFDVTGLAVASIGAAAEELAQWAVPERAASLELEVDRRLASLWFLFSIRPQGWALPSPWDPIAGDYPTRDGWIRLHTNAPHHRDAALSVLGCAADRAAVAAVVAERELAALESAVVEAGGCAAAMRSAEAWRMHPQGRAVGAEPLIAWETHRVTAHAGGASRGDDPRSTRPRAIDPKAIDPRRPLAGVRVLDLTRVLAGPVATRWLAAYGADVLRVDPLDWEEPGVVPEVTVGKRCAGLDLRRPADRARFESLLAEADVLVHGYRPGALARLGYDAASLRAIRPALVDVALCAYGWTGPWAERRGFDSLVQMSAGIADAGQRWARAERPTPLPAQALDHATGYLMAAAAIRGLRVLRDRGEATTARLSLARTAALLQTTAESAASASSAALAPETPDDLAAEVEASAWGPARRLRWPVRIGPIEARFDSPACALRSSPPAWRPRER